jgi:hypothetical protein
MIPIANLNGRMAQEEEVTVSLRSMGLSPFASSELLLELAGNYKSIFRRRLV